MKPQQGKLALFSHPGTPMVLKEYPVRDLRPGEILVRNVYTTICGSDIHTYCGLRQEISPTVLGHEIVGKIIDIHPSHSGFDLRGKKLRIGDLVTWTVFSSNPQSPNSLKGIPQKGEELFKYGHALVEPEDAFHGGLAELCILKANTGIIRLQETMPLAIAATLNCSVSTVAGAIRLAGNLKDKNVLITGMGHLGITCAAMCREAGAEWIGAADIVERRLSEALSFGAHAAFDMSGDLTGLQSEITKQVNGSGIDVVFDMSGSPEAMEFGVANLAVGGCSIWVGAVFNTRPLSIDPEQVIRRLITIKGLHNYNLEDFKNAYDFLKRNWEKYPFSSIVEKEFGLTEVNEAFEYAVSHKPLRVGISLL